MVPPTARLLLGSHRGRFFVAAGLGLSAGVFGSALIAAVAAALHHSAPLDTIVAAFIVAALSRVAMTLISNLFTATLIDAVLADLRIRLARSIIATPLSELESIGNARLMGAITEDVSNVGSAAPTLVTMLVSVGTLVGSLAYLAHASLGLCALVLLVVVLVNLIYARFRNAGLALLRKALATRAVMFRGVSGVTGGLKELKLHAARREEFRDIAVDRAIDASHRDLYTSSRTMALGESLNAAMYWLVAGTVVFVWPQVSGAPSARSTGLLLFVFFIAGPVNALLIARGRLALADGALEELSKLGLALATERDARGTPVRNGWSRISLRAITRRFRSEDDRDFVLGPVDLELAPGQIIFVTGGNGSGKTTLAKILLGLYQPDSGEVRLDGELVTAATKAQYQSLFGAIFAEAQLFDRVLGVDPARADTEGAALLARMQLQHRVQIRGGAFSTTSLSHGQSKRVALTAALLADKSIYVLDEWAAEQDPEFKKVFYTELLPELRSANKCIVVVTHDDRYFSVADSVLQLEEGRVRGAGALEA